MEISKSQVLSFSGISGAALLYSYYFFLKGKSRKIIEKYWGSITGNTRFVYKISMILCVISMISIIYKINKTSKKNYNNEFLGLSMLILSSMFYLPLTDLYLRKPTLLNFTYIVSTLFYVALGAIVLYILYPGIDTFYLSFHLVFLDLLYWSYNFFNF